MTSNLTLKQKKRIPKVCLERFISDITKDMDAEQLDALFGFKTTKLTKLAGKTTNVGHQLQRNHPDEFKRVWFLFIVSAFPVISTSPQISAEIAIDLDLDFDKMQYLYVEYFKWLTVNGGPKTEYNKTMVRF